MYSSIITFNELHLGDNLIHLNYLHKLAIKNPDLCFIHYLNDEYIALLKPLISINNIKLESIKNKNDFSINSWIGYDNYFYDSPLNKDWVLFYLTFFDYFSKKINLENPILNKYDLLFDFPSLNKPSLLDRDFDYLIVNSTPLSNQTNNFDPHFLNLIIKMLVFKNYRVISTHPNGIIESTMEKKLDLLEISRISNRCKAIIGIPNGPMWLTFNVFNNSNLIYRILWLSVQNLSLGNNCFSLKHPNEILNFINHNPI